MNNIEQYKERFYNLMESTMGDVKPLIGESKTKITKSHILKMSEDELKDVYGTLEVKGEYLGEKGLFHHFKMNMGTVICGFIPDKITPSGLKRNVKGIKVKNDDVKF